MKTFGQRVRDERKARRWSQETLAAKVGVTQAAISEIERGVTKASGLVPLIADAFKMEVSELTGRPPRKANPIKSDVFVITPDGENAGDDVVLIPCYDVAGSCGPGVYANEVEVIDAWPMPVSLLKTSGLPAANHLAVVKAVGPSMSPTIEDGDVVILNTAETDPVSTRVYLVCVEGLLFIKRLIYTPGAWVVRSDNPDKSLYPDFKIDPSNADQVQIQGRVVWKSGLL